MAESMGHQRYPILLVSTVINLQIPHMCVITNVPACCLILPDMLSKEGQYWIGSQKRAWT